MDFLSLFIFLITKLPAWKGKNLKTFGAKVFVHLNHLLIVLLGFASSGGNVDKKDGFRILAEGSDWFAWSIWAVEKLTTRNVQY